jgi:anaerobic selenocysteine-containing dehydrogenase
MAATTADPTIGRMAPILLYETLGQTLPDGAGAAAALWALAHRCAMTYPRAVGRAGFEGEGLEPGEALFNAIISQRSGVVFTRSDWDEVWSQISTADGAINLEIPVLIDALGQLPSEPAGLTSGEFPFILAAGERRSFTANTILRDPDWRKRDREGALRMSVPDAERLGIEDGGRVRVSTGGGTIETSVEITDTLKSGHITLPNGFGLDYPDVSGIRSSTGVSVNDLTVTGGRFEDPIAGTPYHKHVPARVEALKRRRTAD